MNGEMKYYVIIPYQQWSHDKGVHSRRSFVIETLIQLLREHYLADSACLKLSPKPPV